MLSITVSMFIIKSNAPYILIKYSCIIYLTQLHSLVKKKHYSIHPYSV